MQTQFEFLPDEINLQFLNEITEYSDLVGACSTPGLSHLCDWNFWRNRAKRQFQVPEDYFDLPLVQGREISASERYLEVISKFRLIPESIARVDGDKVKGNYFPKQAAEIAKRQGNLGVYIISDGKLDYTPEILERSLMKMLGLPHWREVDNYSHQFGTYLDLVFGPRGNKTEKNFLIESAKNMVNLLLERNFEQLEKELEYPTSILNLGVLAASGDEEVFPLVERFFLEANLDNQITLLNFALASRKPEQFIHLFLLTDVPPNRQNGLLRRAYFLAEQTIIGFLEKQPGYSLLTQYKLSVLYDGYRFDPRPVEVYRIFEKIFKQESYSSEFPHLIARQFYRLDTDLFFLDRGENFTERLKQSIAQREDGSKDDPPFLVSVANFAIDYLKEEGFNFNQYYRFSGPILKTLFEQHGVGFSAEYEQESFNGSDFEFLPPELNEKERRLLREFEGNEGPWKIEGDPYIRLDGRFRQNPEDDFYQEQIVPNNSFIFSEKPNPYNFD